MSQTPPLSRRNFLSVSAFALTGAAVSGPIRGEENRPVSENQLPKKPLILHQADLFHQHGDPDDHFDLATLFALYLRGDADIAGLVLDYPPKERAGDPGIIPLAQMNRLCGTHVPAAVGASTPLGTPDDTLENLSRNDQAAIRFIHETLEKADRPVSITCVGSAIDLAAALNQKPELFQARCAGLYLDAGEAYSDPNKPEVIEHNVHLNPAGYAALFNLPAPLYWYPCWHSVESWQVGERGSFYGLSHADALNGISLRLRNFFSYMFHKTESPNWLRALDAAPNDEDWNKILTGSRGMWSTASILMAAGQTVTRDGEIVPLDAITEQDTLYRMENITVACAANGKTNWSDSAEETNRKMFHILDVEKYPSAMARAVNTLFKVFE